MVSIAHLNSAIRYLSLAIGCPILLFGTIGNIAIVLIFTSRKTSLRTSPCSVYFVAVAIISTLHMLNGLPHRILSGGFSIDVTVTSLFFCKLRQYLISSLPFMRNTLSCTAIITQFFATSHQVHYRQKSTHKVARLCITVCIIFWLLYAIPYLVLYKIDIVSTTNKTRCDSFNKALSYYTSWFAFPVLTCILPTIILAVFGYLTLRNVRRLGDYSSQSQKHQQIERQMSLMLLIQVVLLLIAAIPSNTITVYMMITQASSKSLKRKAIESFVDTISFILAYIISGNSFYVLYGTSPAFRKQCKKILQAFCCCTRKHQKDQSLPTIKNTQTAN